MILGEIRETNFCLKFVSLTYHIMGNSCERKHSRFENRKLGSEKIFGNDKSFNLF